MIQVEPIEKPRVFLVDDDEDDRFLFLDAIHDLRERVELHEFIDGETLMQSLTNAIRLPDVIFLDLNLPRKSGLECLEFLRKKLGDTVTKVFIISTSSSPETIDFTRQLGANLYIRKPESFSNLQNLIRISLQKINSLNTVPYYLNELLD